MTEKIPKPLIELSKVKAFYENDKEKGTVVSFEDYCAEIEITHTITDDTITGIEAWAFGGPKNNE